MAGVFFLSFAVFLGFLVDGARFPCHFERNAFIVLIYFGLAVLCNMWACRSPSAWPVA
jgi:hypothetical protein